MTISKREIKNLGIKENKNQDKKTLAELSKLVDSKRQNQLQQEVSKKEKIELGLEKPVAREGFIKFADYNSKALMMDTALFLFGMKLHR